MFSSSQLGDLVKGLPARLNTKSEIMVLDYQEDSVNKCMLKLSIEIQNYLFLMKQLLFDNKTEAKLIDALYFR